MVPRSNADDDRLAGLGLRYTGFHTLQCAPHARRIADRPQSPLRRVGCLANFDSGFPGYRGKIAKEAGTLPSW